MWKLNIRQARVVASLGSAGDVRYGIPEASTWTTQLKCHHYLHIVQFNYGTNISYYVETFAKIVSCGLLYQKQLTERWLHSQQHQQI